MKGIVIPCFGDAGVMRYTDLPDPSPSDEEVLIRVDATSVNFADVQARRGNYHGGRKPPFVPGLEATGTVIEVGSKVQRPEVGCRVVAFPTGGSYLELVLAHRNLTFRIPDSMDVETAAAFPIVSAAVHLMLNSVACLKPGERVLIHAAGGGIGTTAVQMARLFGASWVAGTVGSNDKAELVRSLGADLVINYGTQDYTGRIRETSGKAGVDVVLNSVGGDFIRKDMDCLAPFGRLVSFGASGGEAGIVSTKDLHASNRAVLGFSFGSRRRIYHPSVADTMKAVIDLIQQKKIAIVKGKSFPLEEAAKAHRYLESRQSTGKIVLRIR
jgi:NADPH2:quinone reductase